MRTRSRRRNGIALEGAASTLALVALVIVVAAVVIGTTIQQRSDRSAARESRANAAPLDAPNSETEVGCDSNGPRTLAVLGDSTRDPNGLGQPLIRALQTDLPGTKVVGLGQNGVSLFDYRNLDVQQRLVDLKPDAVELSIGINDLRYDQSDERVQQFAGDLAGYVERLHQELPDTVLHLTTPAALSTQNVGDQDFIQDYAAGVINPDGAAQTITTALRAAFRDAARGREYVELLDVQKKITGTKADPAADPEFLTDQIHPDADTAGRITGLIASDLDGCAQ